MNDISLSFFLFFGEIIALYFVSRKLQTVLYRIGMILFNNKTTVLHLLAILYLPGTIMHELSHYFMAIVLFMKPEYIHIIPQINEKGARLGSVEISHSKHSFDFIRKIIVGVAPFFGALGTLWIIRMWGLFPGSHWGESVLFSYFIFVISGQMFSSAQDLIEVGYIVPVLIIICFFLYVFPVHIEKQIENSIENVVSVYFQQIHSPLLFSLIAHSILILIISLFLRSYDKNSVRGMY